MYDRWFIMPPVQVEGGYSPKYLDDPDIHGFAGNLFSSETIYDAGYHGLIATYPDIDDWYIVRFYGTWNKLNEIHNYQDTRTLADHAQDIAPIMNDQFGVDSWEFSIGTNSENMD